MISINIVPTYDIPFLVLGDTKMVRGEPRYMPKVFASAPELGAWRRISGIMGGRS